MRTHRSCRRNYGRRCRSSKTTNPAQLDCSQPMSRMIDGSPASSRCTANRVLDKTMRWWKKTIKMEESFHFNFNLLVVLVSAAGCVVVLVWLWWITNGCRVISIRLIAVICVTALLRRHAAVVSAVLVLVNVLR